MFSVGKKAMCEVFFSNTSGLPSNLVFDLVESPGLEGGNLPMTPVVLYPSWNWVNAAVLVVGQYRALL